MCLCPNEKSATIHVKFETKIDSVSLNTKYNEGTNSSQIWNERIIYISVWLFRFRQNIRWIPNIYCRHNDRQRKNEAFKFVFAVGTVNSTNNSLAAIFAPIHRLHNFAVLTGHRCFRFISWFVSEQWNDVFVLPSKSLEPRCEVAMPSLVECCAQLLWSPNTGRLLNIDSRHHKFCSFLLLFLSAEIFVVVAYHQFKFFVLCVLKV